MKLRHRSLLLSASTVLALPLAAQQSPLAGLWEFDDNTNLGKATVGTDLTVNGTAPSWVASQTYGPTTLNGVITTQQGTANGFTATHNIGVNGGGTTKTNEYTFIFDVSRPNSTAWRSFWQSDLANGNDAEFFVRGTGGTPNSLGRGTSPGYTTGTLAADTWQRLVVSIDNSNFFRVYLDGTLMAGGARTAQTIDNASYGLDPSQVLLFRDDNGENHSLVIGTAGIYATALSDAQVALLSTAGSAVHRFNPLVWSGADSSEWSNNAIGGSKNWGLGAAAEDFRFADTATFNDSATGTTVDISNGDVTPSSLVFNNSSNHFTITGSNGIAGATTLVMDGSGTVTLGTSNTFTGATSVNAGTLEIANSTALQNSTVSLGASGTLTFSGITSASFGGLAGAGNLVLANDSAAAVALTVGGNNAVTTFSGDLSGSGSLTKSGTGTLTLSGNNSHAGGITLANGAITIAGGNGLGGGALDVTKNGTGTFLSLSNAGNVVIANDIMLPDANHRYDFVKTSGGSTEFSGTLSGGGASTVLRLTTPTAGDNTTIHRLTGNNTLAGTIQIWRGALELDSPAAAGTARILIEANISPQGDLRFTESMTFANDIRLAWTGNVIGVANPSHKVTLSGSIDETGDAKPFTKAGDGSLVLEGTNTYTGATTISAGTLLVNGSLGTTAVTVAANAIIGGTGSLGGSLSFNAASFLHVVDFNDALAVAGTITFGSGFGIANLRGIDWDSLALETPYTVISTGQTFEGTDIANFGINEAAPVGNGRFAYFTSGSLAVVVIPEPSAALLGGLGLLVLLRRRR